ncbi:uncharacterized protein EDB91DRAFT_1256002 [Suillus paluster]|uniref:uncharacterized protein n=1 Tax=Suillus paluster TaxID=48578 RepID=UPI001B862F86|nr:uncharacterized protein EDB91DRAFT_1256002 [Suillus paluster]KAG1722535.1 hypothetical protein EDB91DRAFT_1256002 [Suillus paluster]
MAAKGPSKKGTKTALLKAQENLHTEMVSPAGRTASGRQRRPTKRETYRIFKARQGEEHQKAYEMKMKKCDLKALRTTYQTHPKEFDGKPAGLLSNIDRDEDSMFSDRCVPTKLSNKQALAFSMSKTPPTVLAQKPMTSTTVGTSDNNSDNNSDGSSGSNDSIKFPNSMDDTENESDCGTDNTGNDHDEVAKASSPPVVGTKHRLEDLEVLNTDTKFKKGPNGTRQWLKASNFDEVTKDLLTTATSIYHCLIVTRAPFPETLIIETKLAKDAWREASNMAELTIQLTPSLVKMMTRRTSHVCGELKTKMQVLTASFFGFRASRSIVAIKQNHDLAESLKEGSHFVFKDWEMKCGIYISKRPSFLTCQKEV